MLEAAGAKPEHHVSAHEPCKGHLRLLILICIHQPTKEYLFHEETMKVHATKTNQYVSVNITLLCGSFSRQGYVPPSQ